MKEIKITLKISRMFDEIEYSKNKKETLKKIKFDLLNALEEIKEYDENFYNECLKEIENIESEEK